MATPSQSAADAPRLRRIEKPRPLKWHHHLAALAIFVGLRLLSFTWRLHIIDSHGTLQTLRTSVIFCVWHNRLSISMRAWERMGRPYVPSTGLVALISASHDGGVLARTLKYFNVEAVRGSSSRRGAQALLELTSWVKKNYSIAITPDGPRGPCYRLQDGVVSLAQVTSLPIVPVSTYVNWKWCLKSWDRFQVPLPFARCEIRVGEAMWIGRELSEAARTQMKSELEARMRALTQD